MAQSELKPGARVQITNRLWSQCTGTIIAPFSKPNPDIGFDWWVRLDNKRTGLTDYPFSSNEMEVLRG